MNQLMIKILNEWKKIPSYQLERRVDWLFGILMKHGLKMDIEEELIPEFPVPPKNEINTNRSAHVDFLVFEKKSYFPVLIELKTDDESLEMSQLINYKKQTKQTLINQFVGGWINTSERPKYYALLKMMIKMKMLNLDHLLTAKGNWRELNHQEMKKITKKLIELLIADDSAGLACKVVCIAPLNVIKNKKVDGIQMVSINDFLSNCSNSNLTNDEESVLEVLKGINF